MASTRSVTTKAGGKGSSQSASKGKTKAKAASGIGAGISKEGKGKAAASPSPPRKSLSPLGTRASKKKKKGAVPRPPDVAFLEETIAYFQKTKFPEKLSAALEVHMILPYLKALQPVSNDRIQHEAPQPGDDRGETPDAYELDDDEAKRFLRSTEPLDAPIFLSDHHIPLLDAESETRPVEQFLEWLADDTETHNLPDLAAPQVRGTTAEQTRTVAEIRERFLANAPTPAYPWNLPEIIFPTLTESLPPFLRHPHANVVRDVLRYLTDVTQDDLCTASCPQHPEGDGTVKTAEHCDTHLLSAQEYHQLQRVSRHWLSTGMLAEAGAFTGAHFDTFGFATYICVGEGEMGIAWTRGDVRAPLRAAASAHDGWVFRVLRKGEAVLIDPGRFHVVFRLPVGGGEGEGGVGGQTMAMSTRALRYCDVGKWLEILDMEIWLEAKSKKKRRENEYLMVWRGLLLAASRFLTQARETGRFDKFGGEETVVEAERVLGQAEARLAPLL